MRVTSLGLWLRVIMNEKPLNFEKTTSSVQSVLLFIYEFAWVKKLKNQKLQFNGSKIVTEFPCLLKLELIAVRELLNCCFIWILKLHIAELNPFLKSYSHSWKANSILKELIPFLKS